MPTPDTNTDELPEAQARMANLSIGLIERFGALTTANILAGCAYGVLSKTFGAETAREYFEGLADQIERSTQ